MIPEGRKPSAWMLNQLQLHFGGYERFRSQWIHHCTSVFGQGWVWLIDNDGHLEIVTAYNAGNPVGAASHRLVPSQVFMSRSTWSKSVVIDRFVGACLCYGLWH